VPRDHRSIFPALRGNLDSSGGLTPRGAVSAEATVRASFPGRYRNPVAPEAEAKLKTIFVGASPLDVHETGDFIKAQAKLWGDVIRAAHITIEP
jgi:hypothetical protein